MRWYGIVTGILLILSVVDNALAVPVLVQEKRQARVGEVDRPKNVITGLGKRWDEGLVDKLGNLDGLENMVENHFGTMRPAPATNPGAEMAETGGTEPDGDDDDDDDPPDFAPAA
jgi:hypothetical protein